MEIRRSQTVHSAAQLFILLFDCLLTQAMQDLEEGGRGGSILITIRTGELKTLTKSIED